ncbi:MAG: nuclear transport factor 2 family protein [Streptosporangiaceae bacterium]
MSRSPREVAEQVRLMVAGEGVEFADLFAADGVLTYPFGMPGQPAELRGRETIRAWFGQLSGARDLLDMAGVEAVVRQTDDPEVVVTEITHHGWSKAAGAPYEHTALGVIRVRDGEIVRYDDYMNPLLLARLLGRTRELATALAGEGLAGEGPAGEGLAGEGPAGGGGAYGASTA